MKTCLPLVSGLDVSALSRIFESKTTSYKFALFKALLTICSQRGFSKFDGKISCKDLAVEMAAFAWYPHTFHKLSFGRVDEIGGILDSLSFSAEGNSQGTALTRKRLRSALMDNYQKIGLDSILRHAPFRLLTPFFGEALRGKPDQRKPSLIRHLADEAFSSENPPLYRLMDMDSKVQLHPKWLAYLHDSFSIVSGWHAHNWVRFLQDRNPNVPAIPCKIHPPTSRASLGTHFKKWRRVIQSSHVRCIYSDVVLNENNFELDHFVPWSFVGHDQPWNLIPVLPAANASKGNRLPAIQYIEKFGHAQWLGLSIFRKQLNQREWGRHTESFLVDLRITEEGLLCSNMLGEALNSAVGPMLALAKNSGFSPEWTFQETPVSTICMGKNGLN